MEEIEKRQSIMEHKGVSQRKSYSNMAEQERSERPEPPQSVKMSREGSKSSTNSTESALSKESAESINKIPGQPHNFGTVAPGIYRSSYPQEADYPFLQRLGLKTIITLVDKDIPDTFVPFMKASNIQHRHIVMEGTKKQTIAISTMSSILELIHDKRNQPVLIHCNQGKHRTGCVVAITRMLQHWDLERVVDEYKTYAFPKIRDGDVEYIRKFCLADISHLNFARPAARPAEMAAVIVHPQPVVRPHPLARPHKRRIFCMAFLAIFIMWHSLDRLMDQRTPFQRI
ncbi:unnamed protein product [Discula destructiva]